MIDSPQKRARLNGGIPRRLDARRIPCSTRSILHHEHAEFGSTLFPCHLSVVRVRSPFTAQQLLWAEDSSGSGDCAESRPDWSTSHTPAEPCWQ